MIRQNAAQILGLALILVAIPLFANDTYFYMAGGSLYPTAEGMTEVQMRSEVIRLDLYDDYYATEVEFQFYNPGTRTRAFVGFPIKTEGTHGHGTISHFRSWTNGETDNPELVPIEIAWRLETGVSSAWTRSVDFPVNRIVATRVAYRSTYGRSSPSDTVATYLYGTGSVWAGPIENVEVIVTNHTDRWIYSIKLGHDGTQPPGIEWLSDDQLRFAVSTLEPNYTESLRIHLGPEAFERGPMVYPSAYYFDRVVLAGEQLRLLNAPQLRITRNIVYAMHGYGFRSPDLQKYFGELNWYSPTPSFRESDLNQIERANVDTIVAEEQRRGLR